MIVRRDNNKIYVKLDYFTMPTKTQYLMSKLRDEHVINNSNNEQRSYPSDKQLYRVSCYLSVPDFVKEYEIELEITDNNKLKNKKKLIKMYGEKNINDVEQALNSKS